MIKVIGFGNWKGGCGKTFSVLNCAVGLASKGYKVLAIDTDPQSNTSYKTIGSNCFELKGLNEVIANNTDINDVIYPTIVDNLDLIPAGMNLEESGAILLTAKSDREFLKRCVESITNVYDYILIDTNPGLDIFLFNLVFCCDWIIIPVNVDLNSVMGVEKTMKKLIQTINSTSQDINVDLKILITRVARTKKTKDYVSDICDKYGDMVLESRIRLQSKPAELQTTEDDYFAITDKRKGNNLYEDYSNLVDEIERKLSL